MLGFGIIVLGICVVSEVLAVDEAQCSPYHWQEQLLSKVIRMEIQLENMESKLAAQQQAVRPVCDDDWITYQSACYLFSDTARNFDDAEDFCNSYGGHLVSIRNLAENDFIKRQLEVRTVTRFWVGMTDTQYEGSWRWIDRNDLVDYFQWAGTEPNGERRENCVAMRLPSLDDWVDVICAQSNRPICKKTFTTSATVHPAK